MIQGAFFKCEGTIKTIQAGLVIRLFLLTYRVFIIHVK